MKVNERASRVNVERSMWERSIQERSTQERSTLRFGGDTGGCGFRGASMGWGFGGDLFLLRFFPPRHLFLRGLLEIVLVHDAGHISAGFAEWRHSPILLDALRTCVVSGQRLDEIEVVALQKFAQIAASARDIGLRIEGIVHAQLVGGARHQLHESAGSFGGNGARIESALGQDVAVEDVADSGFADPTGTMTEACSSAATGIGKGKERSVS